MRLRDAQRNNDHTQITTYDIIFFNLFQILENLGDQNFHQQKLRCFSTFGEILML